MVFAVGVNVLNPRRVVLNKGKRSDRVLAVVKEYDHGPLRRLAIQPVAHQIPPRKVPEASHPLVICRPERDLPRLVAQPFCNGRSPILRKSGRIQNPVVNARV